MKLGRFCIAVAIFLFLILALSAQTFQSPVAMLLAMNDASFYIDNEASNFVVDLGQTYGGGKLQPGLAMGIDGAGVEIGPDHSQQIYAGQMVTYSHILTNTSATTDTFSLEVLSMQHWPVNLLGGTYPTGTLMLPLQVGAQMTVSFEVTLVVPVNAAGIVETTIITASSLADPMVWDTAYNTTVVLYRTFLPLILKRWPPLPPNQPTLNAIDNTDGNSLYILSWTEQPSRWADTYILQEATDSAFTTGLRYACTTAQQSCAVNGRRYTGTYYYRVRGYSELGYSAWSNIQTATITAPNTIQANPIYEQGLALRIGDLNGDGMDDVAFTTAEGRLRIWPQNPVCHELQEYFDIPTALYPADLALGDLNADNRADIVVLGGEFPEVVSILFQSSAGFTNTPITYTVGSWPRRVSIGDVNSDGRPDIVVSSNNNLDVLVQQPDGFYSSTNVADPPASSGENTFPYEIAIADFNMDGHNDIATQIFGAQQNVIVYWQRPDGNGFEEGTFLQPLAPVDGLSVTGKGMTAGDVTGDGRADIVVTLPYNMPFAGIVIYPQQISGGFGVPIYVPTYDLPTDPTIVDMNDDGLNDIVVLNDGYGSFTTHYQQPDGNWNNVVNMPVGEVQGGTSRFSDVGDLTGDGLPDFAYLSYNYGFTLVTSGSMPDCPQTPPPAPARAPVFLYGAINAEWLTEMVIGDVNNDGQQEFLTLSNHKWEGKNTIKVVQQLPDGSLAFGDDISVTQAFSFSNWLLGLSSGDLNDDNLSDVAVANGCFSPDAPGEVAVAIQGLDGAFLPAIGYQVGSCPHSTYIADWTGDGLNDLAVVADGGVYILAQQLGGALGNPIQILDGITGSSDLATAADWNRDGRMDLITYGFDNPISTIPATPLRVFLQEANGSFSMLPPVYVPVPTDLQVGDTNSDGRPDIVLSYDRNRPFGVVRIVPQQPDGSLGNRFLLGAPQYERPGGLAIADLNGDQLSDLLVMNSWLYFSVFTQNQAHIYDPVLRYYDVATMGSIFSHSVAQIDEDHNGIPELIGFASPDSYLLFLKPLVSEDRVNTMFWKTSTWSLDRFGNSANNDKTK